MIEIKINSVLTLEDNENYVVVAKTEYEGNYYDYLVQTNDNKEDLIEHIVIVKEVAEDNEIYVEEVVDNDVLNILIPIFKVEMEGISNE